MQVQTQVQTQLQGQYNNEKQLPNPNPLKGLEEKEKEKWALVQQDCDWKNVQVSLCERLKIEFEYTRPPLFFSLSLIHVLLSRISYHYDS